MLLLLCWFNNDISLEDGRKRRGRSGVDGGEGGEGGDGADGEGDVESDVSDADVSADDDRPRKRGRPPASHREKIKGFTDQEVSSFFLIFVSYELTTHLADATHGI